MRDDILIGDTPKARRRKNRLSGLKPRGRLWKHSNLSDIDGIVSPTELTAMYTFTLVRNPWDRLVSYYHWLKVQSFNHPAVGLAKSLPFDAFLRSDTVQASFRSATARSYMTDATGQENCDLYIRLENFEVDAAPLCDQLGFRVALPHLNASDRLARYQGYYGTDSRELVANICAEDIARFGYQFE